MSDILKAAVLTAPIILAAWYFLRSCPEARIHVTGIGMFLRRCPKARIYVTEIGTFLTLMLSYTYFAFSLVTHESPNWLPAVAIWSIGTTGISLSLVTGRRAEHWLKAIHEQQDDSQ